MKVGVEEAVVVGAVMDVDVVELDCIETETHSTMTVRLTAMMDSLEGINHLKRAMQADPLKGVFQVGLVVLTVVVVVVVVILPMERLAMGNVLVGHMNAVVEPGGG